MTNNTILEKKENGMLSEYIDLRPVLPESRRVAIRRAMPGSFENIAWYGRGPYENYSGRNTSAFVDLHESTVAEQYFRYVRPQENGYKTDICWMTLTDVSGFGLIIDGLPLFSGSALHNSIGDLDQGTKKNYRHVNDISPQDDIFPNIDLNQMGVAGVDSRGVRPHPQSQIQVKDYQFRIRLIPVNLRKDDPFFLHKTDIEE